MTQDEIVVCSSIAEKSAELLQRVHLAMGANRPMRALIIRGVVRVSLKKLQYAG
jgi:hypothetical protein